MTSATDKSRINMFNFDLRRFNTNVTVEIGTKRRVSSSFTPTPEANKSFKFGEPGCGLKPRGEVQDFQSLRDGCLRSGKLFVDDEFPPTNSSLFFSTSPSRNLEWRRPHEMVADPKLFVEGATRFDVKQGELGDCWLLAAIANLTLNKKLFEQIVPQNQGFDKTYAGIFYFKFWQYGRWIDVVVDDLLPSYNGRLVFMHSDERNEFWSALLEKAYAKLHGSYEALKGGSTCEAMEDFTGGISEAVEINKAPIDLLRVMLKCHERGSFMACAMEADPNCFEARSPKGLIRGHAYSITNVKYCGLKTSESLQNTVPLVRVRNPWGNEAEWNGPWSDKSDEWKNVSMLERKEMDLTYEHDGEFWMSFEDFKCNFNLLEITNLPYNLCPAGKHSWQVNAFEGAWVRGATAGGCRNYLDFFWRNPQFKITLSETDDGDNDNRCTIIVSLMQKNRRAQRKLGLECLTIGFIIYKLDDPERLPHPLDKHFFSRHSSVAKSHTYVNRRAVSGRFKLRPGTYCIVPSTYEPNEEGEFILRVFSEKKNEMEENDDDIGRDEIDEKVQDDGNDVTSLITQSLRELFLKIAGEDGEINWKELKDILDYAFKDETKFDGFSKDASRSLIAMMDVDKSGKLCLQEFVNLWKNVKIWKNVFHEFDVDDSGQLNGFEVREAMRSAGYRLNNHLLKTLVRRYGDNRGNIAIDDFVMCCAKLNNLMETFESRNKQRTGIAEFELEYFVESTIYT